MDWSGYQFMILIKNIDITSKNYAIWNLIQDWINLAIVIKAFVLVLFVCVQYWKRWVSDSIKCLNAPQLIQGISCFWRAVASASIPEIGKEVRLKRWSIFMILHSFQVGNSSSTSYIPSCQFQSLLRCHHRMISTQTHSPGL